MATEEEEVTDICWEAMKTFAIQQQQYLFENLPDCTIYKDNEHEYLKQNIGFAIYGPPENIKSTSTEKDHCYCKTENPNDADVVETVGYSEDAQKVINKIYDKICTSSVETDDSGSIYYGVIYNMIFHPKTNVRSKKKKVKEEADKDMPDFVMPIPIFTIRNKKKYGTTKKVKQDNTSTDEVQYETLYIDVTSRVYKNWTDYIENNKLPECTMVLPKHGFYESDPAYCPTEDYSTVWLEILESPSCKWNVKFCKGMDVASTVVGFGTIGLSIAALFTPVGPAVAISGIAAATATSAWSFGRNTQQLIDRSNHEESIHVLDKEAFTHYLSMTSTAFGLGAMGGSAIISNVAARGMRVNTFARVAFNTVQGGSLILSGIGVIYQSHCMYDKYKKEKTFDVIDALNLATHLMFFYSSVVKIQFASDIIESTQSKIINDYKNDLVTKRIRRKFNKIVRKAAENNTCKISENAEVILYIKHRQDLLSNQPAANGGNRTDSTSHKIVWSINRGGLKVNGITLLDPIEFVTHLIKLGIFIGIESSDSSNNDNELIEQLTKALCDLLSKLYVSDDCPKSKKLPIMPDFEPLIREMSSLQINKNYLEMLFKITEKLIKRSKNMDDFLLLTFTFVWQYCKANLKQWGITLCPQSVCSNKILQRIIIAIFEAIDMLASNLCNAFEKYIASILHKNE
ncbi:hypothetical protein ALC53_09772 [Atta colombica]|uniref:DUF4781 domain-containing protein n=1 Tax=Atta colombica TaxID=520822 RepID=A0A195B6G6_9HYME|nr:PREDICTED: uncharacterized protein LOC108689815 [Atta colombica]XP_018052244.1 PREDICTED: uncharacterized protein LOC108689815 [Atta colombica]KYM79850.1 hypothetical protein ALC53_09772 [Atta colombica]